MSAAPMKSKRRHIPVLAILSAAGMWASVALPAIANDSAYTKIDFDKTCQWDKRTPEEEDEGMGGCATCQGYGANVVRFCEGDLRQSVHYGSAVPDEPGWNSFGEFNHVSLTVEWRLSAGEPVAAIHRFFIENVNDNGEVTPDRKGQVLVISTVSHPGSPLSCPAGFVDARANADANELARQVADTVAPGFRCGVDRPAYHGTRGVLSGSPTAMSQ
ncbi:MAG: hypothetical protein VYD64_09725 [Pseudomonadota bacterium]|nr:hypothetical protein [Pseudomonadota bacterium]